MINKQAPSPLVLVKSVLWIRFTFELFPTEPPCVRTPQKRILKLSVSVSFSALYFNHISEEVQDYLLYKGVLPCTNRYFLGKMGISYIFFVKSGYFDYISGNNGYSTLWYRLVHVNTKETILVHMGTLW